MSAAGGKAELPENPTLKEINWYKKQINWGELPPFYHLVASSIGESEGLLSHGFDTALKRLIDERNWNQELLNIPRPENDTGKPRIALYQVITDRGFELQAFPFAKKKEVDQYIKDCAYMEFLVWDPHYMRNIIRINQLDKFMMFYFQRGDEADRALIIFAHKLVNSIIALLQKKVNVVKVSGVSVKDLYDDYKKRMSYAVADDTVAGLQSNPLKDGY